MRGGEGFGTESGEGGVGEFRSSLFSLSQCLNPQSSLDSLSAPGYPPHCGPLPSFPTSLSSPPSFCFLGLNPMQTLCPRSLPQDLLLGQPRLFKTHGSSLRKINTFATWLRDREKKGFYSTIIWSLTDCLNHLDTLASFLPDWQPLPLQGPFPLSALPNYSWETQDQTEQLWDDVLQACHWGGGYFISLLDRLVKL